MEVKVGILENEKNYADSLYELLEDWATTRSCILKVDQFNTGQGILQNGAPLNYHIVFIDIQLDDMNGVTVAKELRKRNYTSEIVFLTAFKEYVFEGYNVHALNYILKPITYEKLEGCMDAVLKNIQSDHYTLRNRDKIISIPYSKVIYISSLRHHMEIVTSEETYTHLISIKQLLELLPTQFIRCHRTLIINAYHIKKLEGHIVTMSNSVTLPVSNTYLKSVRKKLESLIF
ncbi:response regulator transcription factor [Enterocloster clostridioformis]